MMIDYSAPVLVVDDQVPMVDLAKRLLGRLGFEKIDHEYDGEKALSRLNDQIQGSEYQLVISDMHMQPTTGLQLLRSIRQHDTLKETRFILMTGRAETSIVIAAKQAGADAYILKPFSEQQLKAKITEVFGRERRASW